VKAPQGTGGNDQTERNTRQPAACAATVVTRAGVAEWLGSGLQSRVHGFESRHSLRAS
jgi:hypothetical protein